MKLAHQADPRAAIQRATGSTGVAGREALHLPPLKMSLSTIYAWSRILEAYRRRHPLHMTRVIYHGHAVQDLRMLVRQAVPLDSRGFELRVETDDGNSQDVPRLLALMEEAAGPDFQHFLTDNDPNRWFPPAVHN